MREAPQGEVREPVADGPVRLCLPSRSLLLVAGLPGAGKSTLLAGLSTGADVVVLDSDAQRATLRRVFPDVVSYPAYRWLVHLLHRCGALRAMASAVPVVVVHLPATQSWMRRTVARLAASTGRSAHLLWLEVEPAEARAGQCVRGRLVPSSSFLKHAGRAEGLAQRWRSGPPPAGWAGVTVLDRPRARAGLQVHAAAPAAHQ